MRLIEDWWTVLWNSATSWVSTFVGGIVGVVVGHWAVILGVLPFMPIWVQLPLSILTGVIVIAGPTLVARITDQPKMQAKIKAKKSA